MAPSDDLTSYHLMPTGWVIAKSRYAGDDETRDNPRKPIADRLRVGGILPPAAV